VDNPSTFGPLQLTDYYFETKKQEADAMVASMDTIKKVCKEYGKLSGRKQPLVDTFMIEDAEIAIMVLSSTAGTARSVARQLRKDGVKVGLIKPSLFRPFPKEEIIEATRNLKALAVLDRSDSFSGQGGPWFSEIRSALYDLDSRPLTTNYVYGLGGRDTTIDQIQKVYSDLEDVADTGRVENLVNYLGVRE
jgi:pyruvate ferredoxin oxidoreductase alpha subunit